MFGSSREYLHVFSKEVASRARKGMSLIAETKSSHRYGLLFFERHRDSAQWKSRTVVLPKLLSALIGSRNPESRFPDSSRHHRYLRNHCPGLAVMPHPGRVVQTSGRGFLKSDRAH